ncbi:MAG: hypothetical protein PIQ35_27445 [Achromobacter xylosoxidans]
MLVSLYTLPRCAASDEARRALTSRGIAFTERSAADQSPSVSPVIATVVDGHLVAWHGHYPDLLDLLADLISEGPVQAHGLLTRNEACEAVLTRQQVLAQVEKHYLYPQQFLDECGDHPLYRGAVLMDWLGY